MRIELRADNVLLDGYVNVTARDSIIISDEKNVRFVEQIMPGVFQRALEKTDDILCFLNHENNRFLGSTKQGNIELWEDNIGLRAICEISDSEVIEKARAEKLKGWSFGFELLKNREEPINDGLKRRFVEDLNLFEVSIIDNRSTPAYSGTSIEIRASDGKIKTVQYRTINFKPKIIDLYSKSSPETAVFDFGQYEKIIKNLEDF